MSQFMKSLAGACAGLLIAAALVVPAHAASDSGYRLCNYGDHVYTASKSAGDTYHSHRIGSSRVSRSWSVDPSSPYRNFHGAYWRSANWYVSAPVLEWGEGRCAGGNDPVGS